MKQIDTRGMSCPQPVLLTKNATKDNPNKIEVLVDGGAPKSNVTRFLKNSGYKVDIKDNGDSFILLGEK